MKTLLSTCQGVIGVAAMVIMFSINSPTLSYRIIQRRKVLLLLCFLAG